MYLKILAVHWYKWHRFYTRNNRYYFKNLKIVRLNTTGDANVIVLRNPVISNVDGDTLDYSDSGAVQYTLQIQYEGYHVKTDSGTANEVRQQISDAIENPNYSVGLPQLNSSMAKKFSNKVYLHPIILPNM